MLLKPTLLDLVTQSLTGITSVNDTTSLQFTDLKSKQEEGL